jgi:hypothetical protein
MSAALSIPEPLLSLLTIVEPALAVVLVVDLTESIKTSGKD